MIPITDTVLWDSTVLAAKLSCGGKCFEQRRIEKRVQIRSFLRSLLNKLKGVIRIGSLVNKV